jgi:hypothetical protein
MMAIPKQSSSIVIDWQYPEPRSGFAGEIDKFMGPGITRAEWGLMLGVVVAAVVALLAYIALEQLPWSAVQIIIALGLALDLSGGVVANAAAPAKRWYHRAGQTARNHLLFIAVHAIHLVLIVLFFRPGDWQYAIITYGYLMIMAGGIAALPLYLQRPAAMAALMGGILLNQYILMPTPGLEWFLPVLYLKLLVCHLLHEEPYRPINEA